jgi:GST-like protein
MTPIELYTYQTPNGHKASIMLEEIGLPYSVRLIDIEKGDQTRPDFLALNPNNKIPVIVDRDVGRTVFESGAILHYLARRSGKLQPTSAQEADDTLTWTLFQAAHVGPTLGQLWNYKIFAPHKMPYVIGRFERETGRVFRVLESRLNNHENLVGKSYGIADVMTWPWIHAGVIKLGLSLDDTPNLVRWYAAIGRRPAVIRGIAVPALPEASAAA